MFLSFYGKNIKKSTCFHVSMFFYSVYTHKILNFCCVGADRERLDFIWTQIFTQVSLSHELYTDVNYHLHDYTLSVYYLYFRYSHLDGEAKEVSPVIDQFLECVWQLMQQFPCSFEYNEKFLISIHNHVYSCHYGNFIGNSQMERRHLWYCPDYLLLKFVFL